MLVPGRGPANVHAELPGTGGERGGKMRFMRLALCAPPGILMKDKV